MRPLDRDVMGDKLYLRRIWASHKPSFYGGLESPPLEEHLAALEFELPQIPKHGRAEFHVETLAGRLGAAVMVQSSSAPEAPVVIYHHDAGELPPSRTLEQMFPRNRTEVTAIGIEAPFHESGKEFKAAAASLMNYVAMIAVPIAVTEQLIASSRFKRARVKVVAGYGQGGVIANRHHMMFDTADLYFPFMAGAAPADLFLNALTPSKALKKQPELIRALLDFGAEWRDRDHPNVFPVLGSSDFVNRFDAQARSYGKTPIEVWPAAHMVTAKHAARMRDKILKHILAALRAGRIVAA